jgi:hypothetical protein
MDTSGKRITVATALMDELSRDRVNDAADARGYRYVDFPLESDLLSAIDEGLPHILCYAIGRLFRQTATTTGIPPGRVHPLVRGVSCNVGGHQIGCAGHTAGSNHGASAGSQLRRSFTVVAHSR